MADYRTLYTQVKQRSGLGVNERAVIYGVTRQTIRRWDLGMFPRSDATIGLVTSISTKLVAAVAAGLLPIAGSNKPASVARVTRRAKVEKIRTIVRG